MNAMALESMMDGRTWQLRHDYEQALAKSDVAAMADLAPKLRAKGIPIPAPTTEEAQT